MSTMWKLLIGAAVAAVLYAAIVLIFGFMGVVAGTVHFGRVALATAVLIIYVPLIATIFKEVPAPRRDYLIAGIILTWTSALGFAVWNELGRRLGVATSIFVSPVAGFFSALLVAGALFHIVAPDADRHRRVVALVVGVLVGAIVIGSWLLIF